jgi:predicted dehydrogenase
VAFNLRTHLVDQIVYAFGWPKKVMGFVAVQREGGTTSDACTILLHYDDMLATVKCSALSAQARQLRFWVRGDKGSLKKVRCPDLSI